MALQCANPNHPDYKDYKYLEENVGNARAQQIFEDNGGVIPTGENADAYIERYKSQNAVSDAVNELEVTVEEMVEKLSNPDVVYDEQEKVYKHKDTGEVVNERVSDKVNAFKHFKGTSYEGKSNPIFALKGTVVHKYMESILKRITGGENVNYFEVMKEVKKLQRLDDFSGKDESFFEVTKPQFTSLLKAAQGLVNAVQETQKAIDPKGKVNFFHEVSILDPLNDLAGTVDFLAVFSDGTASIYDFKTFKKFKTQSPNEYKIEDWEIQMAQYKRMLKNNYGIAEFRQTRAIPIATSYDRYNPQTKETIKNFEAGFQKLEIQTKSTNQDYLNPIPFDEKTGDKKLDILIEKLIKERNTLTALINAESTISKRKTLQQRKKRISKALKDLQLNQDMESTFDDVRSLVKYIRNRMHKSKSDNEYITINELSDTYYELDLYSDLTTNFQNQLKNYNGKEKASLNRRVQEATKAVNNLREDIMTEMVERLGGDEITEYGDAPTGLSRWTYGINNWNVPVFQKLNELRRYSSELTRRHTERQFEEIKKADNELREWGRKNGYSGIDVFDLLLTEEKNLVSEYDKSIWQERKKRREKERLKKEDIQWLNSHFEFDRESFEKDLKDIMQETNILVEQNVYTEAQYKREIANFKSKHDPKINGDNLFRTRYVTIKENQTYKNKKWLFIQKHDALKNYYDLYRRLNRDYAETIGARGLGENFVLNIRKQALEGLLEGDFKDVQNAWKRFKSKYEIRSNDEVRGKINERTGQQVPSIPLLGLDPIRDTKLKEGVVAEIEREVAAIYDKGTQEYNDEVKRRTVHREYQEGTKQKSTDLTKSLMMFVYNANDYINTQNIEGQAKALRSFIEQKRIKVTARDKANRTLIDKFTGQVFKQVENNEELLKFFDLFVNRFVYKQKYEKDWTVANYSRNKMIQSMMNYFSARSIGANFVLVAANFIQAKTGMWMAAREGRYFNQSTFKDTMNAFTGMEEQFENVVDFFMPSTRDILREDIELSGATWASRRIRTRSLFLGHIKGDDHVDNTLTVAMAKFYRVDSDGKIKREMDGLIDENAPTVYDSVKTDGEGHTFIPGLSYQEFANFRAKIQKQGYLIKGMMSEEQKGAYGSYVLGDILMQFRSWSVGLAEQRLGKVKYDHTMEDITVGRFNAAFSEIIGNGMTSNIKEVSKLLGEAALMGIYKRKINRAGVEAKFKKFLRENQQYEGKITVDQYIQMHKQKINALLGELRVYLGFFVLVQLLGGLEWDDEEEGNLFTLQSHQIARRALLEVSFWFSPSSVNEVIRNPFPLFGMINELGLMLDNSITETAKAIKGEEDARDRTHLGYYTLRNTPALNQVLRIFGYFEKYHPPKSTFQKVFSSEEDEE